MHERFAAAFPGHTVIQGGISLGTLEDVTASLDYVRRIHGVDALPERLVLGISPRFIANIPDVRPFKLGIDRYSPYVSTRQEIDGIGLVPKSAADSLRARARFLASKEPERFRTALLALAYRAMAGRDAVPGWTTDTSDCAALLAGSRRCTCRPLPQIVRAAGFGRILDHSLLDLLAWRVSPYKYTFNPPIAYGPDADLDKGWWKDVYGWNPLQDWQDAMAHVRKFNALVEACGIDVWVVNLPERDVSRAQFDATNYGAYMSLVGQAFGEERLLDLREFLRPDEFYDREHTLPAGSRRLTDAVIAAMRAAPGTPRNAAASRQACADFDPQ